MNVGQSTFRAIADFSAIRREARRTHQSLNDMADGATVAGSRGGKALVTGFLKAMAKLTVLMPMLLGIGASALSAVGGIVSLGSSLGVLAGAALPLLGIFAGVGIAVGVLKAVLKDFADVMPDVVERFGALQDSLSSTFWDKAAGPMRDMIDKVFPAMEAGLHGVATAWGEIAAEGATTLGVMLMANGNMTSMLDNTTAGLRAANPGLQALIKGIVTLGAFGATYLPAVGAWVSDLGLRFNAFIQTANADGSLTRWTNLGIAGMRDLGSVIGSVFGILGALQTAAASGGATATLHGLAEALARVEAVMQGPTFQTNMATIFAGAAAGAAALHSGIGDLVGSLGSMAPFFAQILTLGGQIAGMLMTGLGPALQNPAFTSGFVTFLEGAKTGMSNLTPLLPGLTTAIGSLLTNAAPLAEVALPTFVEVITLLAGAIAALLPVVTPMVQWLSEHPALIAAVVAGFMILTTTATAFGAAANIVSMGMKLWAGASKVASLAMKGLQAVLAAGPIGLLIIAIAALVAGLIWFFTKTELGQQIVTNVWNAIKTAVSAVVDWFTGTVIPALVGVWEAIKSAWSGAVDFFSGLWDGVVGLFMDGARILQTAWETMIDFFRGVWEGITGVFTGSSETVQGVWSGVSGFFQSVGQAIMDFFRPVGDFFVTLWNVLKMAVLAYVNFYISIWNALVAFFQPVIQLFMNLMNMFGAIFGFVAALIGFAIDVIILTFMHLWNRAVELFNMWAAFLTGIFQTVSDFIVGIWNTVSSWLAGVWQGIVDVATTAWNAVYSAVSSALQTAWDFIVSIWNQVVGFLTGVLTTIVNFVTEKWNTVSRVINDALEYAKRIVTTAWNNMVSTISGVLSRIWSVVTDVWNRVTGFISGVVERVRSTVANAWNAMVGAVSGPAQRIYNSVVDAFQRVVGWLGGVGGRILGALGNLGSLLWNAGTSIVQGLLDGLNAMIGNVTDFFHRLTAMIPDWKGPLPLDKVLLTGAGEAIMNGLLKGLESMYDPVRDSLTGFTSGLAASAEVPLTLNSGFDPGAAMLSGWDRAYETELAPEINSRATLNESPGDTYMVDKLTINNPTPEPASDSLPKTIRTLSGVGVRKS